MLFYRHWTMAPLTSSPTAILATSIAAIHPADLTW